MVAAPAPLQRFSTRTLGEGERVGEWEAHNAAVLFDLGCRAVDGSLFEASAVGRPLHGLSIAKVSASAHVVERTTQHIGRADSEGVVCYFSLTGQAFFYSRDGVHVQQPGTVLIADTNQPFMRGFAEGFTEYVLTVPRQLLDAVDHPPLPLSPIVTRFDPRGALTPSRRPGAPGAGAIPVTPGTPGTPVTPVSPGTPTSTDPWAMPETWSGLPPHRQRPFPLSRADELVAVIRSQLSGGDDLSTLAAEQRTVTLLGELLTAALDPTPTSTAQQHRRAAEAWMRTHLRDPRISVAQVATAVRLSERQLNRAFTETGQTVARTLLELRLELAHQHLARPGAPSVQSVALSCGFASPTHFSRVFKQHFGYAPSSLALR